MNAIIFLGERGRGPCAETFEGKDCPYYPVLPMIQRLHPACCDKLGCYCECIYYCANVNQVSTL